MGITTDRDVLSISARQERELIESRIRELEAEVERMMPVVEAALAWNRTNYRDLSECEKALDAIGDACDAYEAN